MCLFVFVSGLKTKRLRQLIDTECGVSGTNTLVFACFIHVCMWFSFAGDDLLGESGDGDEDDCG